MRGGCWECLWGGWGVWGGGGGGGGGQVVRGRGVGFFFVQEWEVGGGIFFFLSLQKGNGKTFRRGYIASMMTSQGGEGPGPIVVRSQKKKTASLSQKKHVAISRGRRVT